ncbi:hypothetical protein AB6A40_000915 [Gnathostoma spinigerum]|uniref:Chromatin assembly factor 1 subunit A n=1 Tax=Gnathostoma spinigerum TaxID=75299 RepID=A0ABD6E567_9BILA
MEEVKENLPTTSGKRLYEKSVSSSPESKRSKVECACESCDEVITIDDECDDGPPTLPPQISENEIAIDSEGKLRARLSSAKRLKRNTEEKNKAEERFRKLKKAAAGRDLKAQQLKEVKAERKKEREMIRAQKRQEKERAREEHRKAQEEKKRQEEEAKKLREEEKEARKRQEEEKREKKRREEEEEREKRRREQEEKRERKRKEEEEKEAQREQRRKEEEERKERKRREEEAIEMKKRRQSDRFLSFFSKIERQELRTTQSVDGPFKPFEVKEGMTLAPILVRSPLNQEEYDHLLHAPPPETSYLSTLPKRQRYFKSKKMRAKLFQFHDNYRPPYYGTWRKTSSRVTGRRPFAKDDTLDYEVDSDEEWEEEVEGDDCDDDRDEEVEPEEKCSDDEDGFLVEHGYLSAGEGEDDDTISSVNDTERQLRLQAKAEDWKKSVQQKSTRNKKQLFPILYGPRFGVPPPDLLNCCRKIVIFSYDENTNFNSEE